MVRIRTTILLVALVAALLVAGCGGGDGGGGSSGSGLADFAAPGSVVFVEGNLQPSGELKANADAVAKRLAGIDDLGEFVVSELEKSAGEEGEAVDFAKEVEPWLGKEGGAAFERLERGRLAKPLILVQTTDPRAAEAFVYKRAKAGKGQFKRVSYKGVDFEVGGSDGKAVGVVDEVLVIAAGEKELKAAVDASQGESLGNEDRFQKAIAVAPSGSLANIYIDLGGIVGQAKGELDPETRVLLESTGIDPNDATAVAGVIPHSEQIEVDVSSALGGQEPPKGNASELLGSLPASSVAAFGFSDFGQMAEKALNAIDQNGAPPNLKPGELQSVLKQAGVNVEKIAASLEEGGLFVEGDNRADLTGALVVTSSSNEAAGAVASLGTLLRTARVPGVTAVTAGASGFSIRSKEFGDKPVTVVDKGNRVAIGYGLAPALAVLNGDSGPTLSGQAGYKAAVAALGKMPISGYVDGPPALRLAKSLVPRSATEFWDAVPYLSKVTYIGIGTGVDGEFATAKLIAGIGK